MAASQVSKKGKTWKLSGRRPIHDRPMRLVEIRFGFFFVFFKMNCRQLIVSELLTNSWCSAPDCYLKYNGVKPNINLELKWKVIFLLADLVWTTKPLVHWRQAMFSSLLLFDVTFMLCVKTPTAVQTTRAVTRKEKKLKRHRSTALVWD